jgi:hypothetical protein
MFVDRRFRGAAGRLMVLIVVKAWRFVTTASPVQATGSVK